MRFFILPILLFFCSFQSVIGQNIAINIQADNLPLEFATVQIANLKQVAQTDSTGTAFFQNLPNGKHLVEISFVGYEKLKESINISETERSFSFTLQPLANTLNDVVVTGNLKAMRKAESIVAVEMFSPRYFARNPTPSLFEAMSSVNGVRPQLQCSVCNTGDIHINGMEGPYTMVLIDNMPIVSGLSTVYGLSGIPNAIVQRIEVVKGPAAALYGSEAMGGIINVITKNPAQMPRFSIDLSGTSYQEWNGDAAFRFGIGKKLKSVISGSYFHLDKRWDINRDNFTDITLAKRGSVFNKWSLQRKNNRVADVAFRFVKEDRFGGEMQWTPTFRGGDSIYGESIYTTRYEAIGNYQLPIEKEKIMFNFSANRHIQDSYYGTTPYMASQDVVFGQLTWDKKLNTKNDFLLGVGHRYTYYDDNTPVTETASKKTLTGVFLQNETTFNPQLKTIVGIRYDRSNVHGNIFSPRLGAKYTTPKGDAFRLNIGNGFRVVNVFSEDHAALTGGRKVEFINELQPERSWNANLNYTRTQTLKSGFVNLDASLFYTYYDNKIIADYLSDPEKIIFDNLQGYAQNYGIALNTDWTFENGLKSTIGATYLRSYIYENGNHQEQIQTPNLTANYSVSYSFLRQHLTIDFNGYLNSPMLLPTLANDYRSQRSPFFNISNVQLTRSWAKNGIDWYGGVKNLFNFFPKGDIIMRAFDPFDKKVSENNPNNYTFDPSYNYAPLQGLRVFMGLRVKIK